MMTWNASDLVAEQFGRLTVTSMATDRAGNGERRWLCSCECGGSIEATTGKLRSGRVRSCGCLSRDLSRQRLLEHGHAGRKTPEYRSWQNMWKRCTNPKSDVFEHYGGRGISVCDRWRSFEAFLADMGPRPPGKTIDRFPDPNGNYEPGNCRWATQSEQMRNTRRAASAA